MALLLTVAALPVVRGDGTFRNIAVRVAAVSVLTLVVALVNGWPPLVPIAVALAGGTYAAELGVDDAPLDAAAPVIAVALFLTAELAYWSLDERDRLAGDPGEGLRRAGFVALVALGAFFVGAALLTLADALRAGGLALDLLGAAAAVAALAVVVASSRRRSLGN